MVIDTTKANQAILRTRRTLPTTEEILCELEGAPQCSKRPNPLKLTLVGISCFSGPFSGPILWVASHDKCALTRSSFHMYTFAPALRRSTCEN